MVTKTSEMSAPRVPQIPEITSVKQVLPALRVIVKRKSYNLFEGLELKPGEKVLILSDSTINPILTDAFTLAIKEAGGRVEIITLEGYPDLREPVDLVDKMFSNNWFHDWVWEAAAKADVFLHLAFLKMPLAPGVPLPIYPSKGRVRVQGWELPLDLLVLDYVSFPVEVRDAIDQKTWELVAGAREIELSDPLGTDLVLKLTPGDWEGKGEASGGEKPRNLPGHLMLPLPAKELDGVLVTNSITFGGPIPRTKLTIRGRQVTQVESGGLFGERLRQSFEQYRDQLYPGNPGSGANWLRPFAICTHPKARPSPAYDKLAGSSRVHAWAPGHRRAGIIHTGIGMAMANPRYRVVRFVDLQFATLVADKRVIIDQGHLTALDDEEVRRVAAQYGHPDKLLREDWIPAITD